MNKHKIYSGLVIEFKSPNGKGKLSPEQYQVCEALKNNNYKVIVSNNLFEIINEINIYAQHLINVCNKCHKFYNKRHLCKK